MSIGKTHYFSISKRRLSLESAYEECRQETARWAKTFYLGTLLMPKVKRRAIWAIYVWCRRTDELMDSPEAMKRPIKELSDRLDNWEERTRAIFSGRVENAMEAALVDTIERFPQSIQPYLDMIDGQRMDLKLTRYKTFKDLELYCYRVAGTVGLMTQGVMGVEKSNFRNPPDTSEAAVALGIANQLTNILRDVGEDRERGRIYLPLEDLKAFNYSEDDLLNGVINDQWKNLMSFQLTRAREWFAKSEYGVRLLSPDARWPVWASLRLYRGILDSIEKLDYDVFNNRAYVSQWGKIKDLPISFFISQSK